MANPDDYTNPDLSGAEQARLRRRDRDAQAQSRAGMRTGLAKGFKQIQDAQIKRGLEAKRDLERIRGRRIKDAQPAQD